MFYKLNETHTEDLFRSYAAVVGDSHAIINVAVDLIEQITALNLKIAMDTFNNSAQHAHAVMEVEHPHQALSLHAEQIHPLSEKLVGYSADLFQITNNASAKMAELLNANLKEMGKDLERHAINAAQNSPLASEVALAAIKSASEFNKSAYEKMNETVEKATQAAQAQASVTKAAAKKSSRKAAAN